METRIEDTIKTLERVYSLSLYRKYPESARDVIPLAVGKTIDDLAKHLSSLRYLSLVLCGGIPVSSLPAMKCPELEDSLKKHQNLERLSDIVEVIVHTTSSSRCVITLTIRLTKAFDTYAANAFLPDNFNPKDYKDLLFHYISTQEDGDYVLKTFSLSFIYKYVKGDISLGLVSSSSLLESLKKDIQYIESVLDHIPKPHPLDSICRLRSKNIILRE